jgi:hypothetical protein
MPINNLNTNANAHSSIKVKDEYEAKHEAGVAGKMASVSSLVPFKIMSKNGGQLGIVFNLPIVPSVFLLLRRMLAVEIKKCNI